LAFSAAFRLFFLQNVKQTQQVGLFSRFSAFTLQNVKQSQQVGLFSRFSAFTLQNVKQTQRDLSAGKMFFVLTIGLTGLRAGLATYYSTLTTNSNQRFLTEKKKLFRLPQPQIKSPLTFNRLISKVPYVICLQEKTIKTKFAH
jgi:hypothetical protein